MSHPLKVKWQHSPEELERSYRQETDGRIKIRMYALWKMSEGNSAKSVAKSIGYSYNAVLIWLQRYRRQGLSGLKDKEGRGRKRQISEEEIDELRDLARKGELATLQKSRILMESKYEVNYSVSGAWRLFKRINLSWKVPRPKHINGDPDEQEAFKKGGSLTRLKSVNLN